jgi:hypothetical protein
MQRGPHDRLLALGLVLPVGAATARPGCSSGSGSGTPGGHAASAGAEARSPTTPTGAGAPKSC